jgi:glutaminase
VHWHPLCDAAPVPFRDAPAYVSTGALPDREHVQALVDDAYERYRVNRDGEPSPVYPALRAVDPDVFGVCVVDTDGASFAAGDASHEFTIMSVSKPFVFALVCELLGAAEARRLVGVNATGLPFNSLAAIERADDGRTNPMVNGGAIATTSLAPGASPDERWRFIHDGLSRFAGRGLAMQLDVYESALATNARNQAIAQSLRSFDRLYCEPAEAVDLYTASARCWSARAIWR